MRFLVALCLAILPLKASAETWCAEGQDGCFNRIEFTDIRKAKITFGDYVRTGDDLTSGTGVPYRGIIDTETDELVSVYRYLDDDTIVVSIMKFNDLTIYHRQK